MTKDFDGIGQLVILSFVVLIFCCKLTLLSAQNDHTEGWIYGVDLSYECLGSGSSDSTNTYKITMKHYRECDTIFPENYSYLIYVGQEISFLSFTLMELDTVVEATNLVYDCQQLSDSICFNVGYYSSFGEFPISDTSYYAVFFKCCRGDNLVNIPPSPIGELPIGFGSFIEITSLAQEQCNNSPVFHELPPTVICKDDLLQTTLVAEEADGDQLVYEFNNPFNWAAGYDTISMMPIVNIFAISPPPYPPIPFRTPEYDYLHPFGVGAHHSLDPNTGELEIIPNQTGDYTIGFKVSEYRNGELLSTAYQDLVIKVVECTPTVEALIVADNTNDEGVFVTNLCNANELLIDNQSAQLVYLEDYTWQFEFNDSSWIDTTWAPALSFEEGGTLQAQFLLNGSDNCNDTAYLQVNVTPELYADFDFTYDTCSTDPITFSNASSVSDGSVSSFWGFGDGTESSLFSPIHAYTVPGDYEIQLLIENDLNCQDSISKQLNWYPIPEQISILLSDTAGCYPLEVSFEGFSFPFDDAYDIYWELEDSVFYEGLNPYNIYHQEGSYSLDVSINSPQSCYLDTFFREFIQVSAPQIAAFAWTPLEVSNLNPVVDFLNDSERNFNNFWQINGQLVSQEEYLTHKFVDEGMYEVELAVTDQYGCTDTISHLINNEYKFTYFLPNSFTPNGDGKNDSYRGVGVFVGITNFEMVIWNRAGKRIFATNDIYTAWDGYDQQSGRPSYPGVYLCTVQFQFEDKEWVNLKEQILLMR